MKAGDRILQEHIPHYNSMKKAGAFKQDKKKPAKKKPTTITELSQSGKAVLKHNVTVSQAAKKLHDYEETGLQPREVLILIERARNLEKRVEKLEGWK